MDNGNEADTAKCPECGSKYLVKTGYCMKCKKKVGKTADKRKESIEVVETFKIPGTDIIVEAGQNIEVISEGELVEATNGEEISIIEARTLLEQAELVSSAVANCGRKDVLLSITTTERITGRDINRSGALVTWNGGYIKFDWDSIATVHKLGGMVQITFESDSRLIFGSI